MVKVIVDDSIFGIYVTFVSYRSDKGLITRIYRELKKLNSPQINKEMGNCTK
jgi:hypothetical protein